MSAITQRVVYKPSRMGGRSRVRSTRRTAKRQRVSAESGAPLRVLLRSQGEKKSSTAPARGMRGAQRVRMESRQRTTMTIDRAIPMEGMNEVIPRDGSKKSKQSNEHDHKDIDNHSKFEWYTRR